ncbi:hypothetical protein [Neisseria meningitidis serogroup B]|uniref:Uncharacterized protein n=1 Tax=Neisseria meningitidis serogroup B TaxID=491 RepID=A0A0H5QCV1_NEIMI|nr:hypothetical protein [Neisseria meningitidis serogroup B]
MLFWVSVFCGNNEILGLQKLLRNNKNLSTVIPTKVGI